MDGVAGALAGEVGDEKIDVGWLRFGLINAVQEVAVPQHIERFLIDRDIFTAPAVEVRRETPSRKDVEERPRRGRGSAGRGRRRRSTAPPRQNAEWNSSLPTVLLGKQKPNQRMQPVKHEQRDHENDQSPGSMKITLSRFRIPVLDEQSGADDADIVGGDGDGYRRPEPGTIAPRGVFPTNIRR